MSDITASDLSPPDAAEPGPAPPLPVAARYGLALAFVAVATLVAFVVDKLIQAPNLSLVFVLPVVMAAVSFGWGPALAAALAGVLAFDFFFVEPRYSLLVANPTDLWALALLLVIAAVVSSVAAQSRLRALEAREAAVQAEALHDLAHVIIRSPPPAEVARAAAEALARLFNAPAVVLVERDGVLGAPMLAGGATLSPADREAATVALTSQLPTRAETYPVGGASFDFWPVQGAHGRSVLGVRLGGGDKGRPSDPQRLVEIVGAYLAVSLARAG